MPSTAAALSGFDRLVNRWSVIPQGEQSLLVSEAELEIKGGVFGRILERILELAMRRMGPNALAGFKYFVEQGHAFQGKASDLPRAPVAC